MSRRRILIVILTILTAINVGLLWDGGSDIAADTEWDNTQVARSLLEQPQTNAEFASTSLVGTEQGNSLLVDGAVPIRSTESLLGKLSASGKIELVSQREIALAVDGTVNELTVSVGDEVVEGTLLLLLETGDLERAVRKASAEIQTIEAELNKLHEGSSAAEIAAAEASIASAKQGLLKAQQGATSEEIAAAESKLNAANAKYAELQSGPSNAELDEARAELAQADVDRQAAQREYDKVAWQNDIGLTPESAQLQKATIAYDRSVAKFNQANKPASQSELQTTLADIQSAQHQLDALRNRPNPTEVSEAQAKVAEAEQQLAKLNQGPSAATVEEIQSRIAKAQLDLEEAQTNLARSEIRTPISGTVLELKLTPGQRGNVGDTAVIIADTRQLKLTVEVAEIDVPHIQIGQEAEIKLDALQEQSFNGVVEYISPTNKKGQAGIVSYPATIRLTNVDSADANATNIETANAPNLASIRPGMNAVATFLNEEEPANRWLVPQSALTQREDGRTMVVVQRGERLAYIDVTVGESVGEWVAVESPELATGDAVLGQLASSVDEDNLLNVEGF